MDMEKLEIEFEEEMLRIHREAKKACPGFKGDSRFLGMINQHGGVDTAKRLLEDPGKVHDGFADLVVIHKRPDLTSEHLVLIDRFQPLFDERERDEAKRRLGR